MDFISTFLSQWIPTVTTALFFVALYFITKKILQRQAKGINDKALIKGIILFTIAFIGIISVVLALPMSTDQKGQVSSLIGIVLSAVLGLSSTTFIGNALAGISLKLRGSFKPGDFIAIDNLFGRVTKLGLFHTEVQTSDRDLTSLPNMTLASNPLKVTRSSGTFISAEVSLGYDVNRLKVEEALIKAAGRIGLDAPFVHVISLGDFSIVYRVKGLLKEVDKILGKRSALNGAVIDCLHEVDIEIMSPNFVNRREIDHTLVIAKSYQTKKVDHGQNEKLENVVFDKAEEAQSIEKRKERLEHLEQMIADKKQKLQNAISEEEQNRIKEAIEKDIALKTKLENRINEKVDELESKV